jgi:hypothetical protein
VRWVFFFAVMQSIVSFVARQLVAVGISLCGESFSYGSCKEINK